MLHKESQRRRWIENPFSIPSAADSHPHDRGKGFPRRVNRAGNLGPAISRIGVTQETRFSNSRRTTTRGQSLLHGSQAQPASGGSHMRTRPPDFPVLICDGFWGAV